MDTSANVTTRRGENRAINTPEASEPQEPPEIEILVDRILSNRRETFSLPPEEEDGEPDTRRLDNVDDLKWWFENNPKAILRAMHLLRTDSQDCLNRLQATQELYIVHQELQSNFNTQHKELRKSRSTTARQADTITELEQQLDGLATTPPESSSAYTNLEAKIAQQATEINQLKEQLHDVVRHSADQQVPMTRFEHLSPEVPDPPLLTDGESPTWMEWHQGIQYKRTQNADHFPTQAAEVQYVLSRLSGNAYRLLEFRTRPGSENPFTSVSEIFEALGGIFDDSDRKEKLRRSYQSLTMGSDQFQKFFVEFYSLGKNLGRSDTTMVDDLKDKVPNRLVMSLANSAIDAQSLFAVRDLFTRSDNAYRFVRESKSKSEPK